MKQIQFSYKGTEKKVFFNGGAILVLKYTIIAQQKKNLLLFLYFRFLF